MTGYAFSSLDELGEGQGLRKIRRALGVTAFGVNAIVFGPGAEGFAQYHEQQDELYFVHRRRELVEVAGETRELAEGGLLRVESTTSRQISNASGKGGYVERDGQLVDPARDVARRRSFG